MHRDGSRVVVALVLILIIAMMIASQTLLASAQTSNDKKDGSINNDVKDKRTTFRLKLSTLPDKLVRGEDAYLIIQMQDNRSNPVQFLPEIISISVLDDGAISISDSIEKIGNAYAVKIRPLKSIETKITVVAKGLGTMLETINVKVYESLSKPSKLALNIKPSNLSYIGPREGYIAVQLLNTKDEPVYADNDYLIELNSSNIDLLQVNNVIIKQGTNYAYVPFSIKDTIPLSNPYITITAKHGNMYAEGMIKVEMPDKQVLRLYVMDMVPAVRGHEVYAFVQLQDPNGNAIYAEEDMRVEVKPDSMLLIGGTGTIRKGESTTVISLYVNTDKSCDEILQSKDKSTACVGIIASSNNLTSNKAMVKLVEPVYVDGSQYISESKEIRVIPRFFPDNMPIIVDGRSKVIGAVQLMVDAASEKGSESVGKSIRPLIVPLDTPIDIVSDNRLAVEDTRVTIARGKSAALINAKVGYNASETRIYTISDYVDDTSFSLNLQGHKDVTIVGEPLISRVSKGMDIPFIIYFKDSNGYSSYAPDDMSLRIGGGDDKIEVIKSNAIARGSANAMVQLRTVKEGDATLYVEAIGSVIRYASTGSISITSIDSINVSINMLDPILSKSKAFASLELVDSDGYPVHTRSDVRALIFSSGLDVPDMLVIPKGKYFTLFTVEASNPSNYGSAEITAMVDGFGIIKRDVKIISNNPPTLKLSAPESVKPMDQFDVTLDASYAGVKLSNMQVSWSSDLAILTNMYDNSTNEQGNAMARFIAYKEGVITVTVKVSGYGIEESASIKINSIDSNNNNRMDEDNYNKSDGNIAYGNTSDDANATTIEITNIINELPIDAEYLLMLPAVGGIMTWYVSKKLRKKA
ncbi:hypothetical protein [Candidatus Nitrosocaldus cavascurensis]|uniref:Uncharacterized protein n=1 Tax=Candidatus Nitrosocaldus cavascurensis TaxID=2058097 RepID=A0A2K5ASB3_9ARCH|nr:hypothetical protein [Candidatus Nitrosocaldus cavascurensis]SPC34527.1 exported protein of unknown function [Candidatus Nitrosocaldus cavascurensis]